MSEIINVQIIPQASIASEMTAPNQIDGAVSNLLSFGGSVDDVKVNGTSVVTNKVANVTVPTKTSDITNDSGFITNSYHDSTKQDVLTAGQNISIVDNVISATGGDVVDVKVNGTTVVDVNKIAQVAVPTKTSDITNDSGFITSDALTDYATKTYVNNHHDSTKQDNITDLSDIRAGASSGATAVQPAAISDMATKTWVGGQSYATETYVNNHHDSTKQNTINDLTDIRTGATAGATALQPNDNITQLTNNAGYITSSAITGKEDTANKVTSITSASTDTQYSSAHAVYSEVSRLDGRIDNLSSRGRYLSQWNPATGKPNTDPTTLPYNYNSGDYYVIGTVPTSGNIYRPSGAQYTGAASLVLETSQISSGDTYLYDGSIWILQINYVNIPVADVKIGGTSVVDDNKIAQIPSIPTKVSDLTNDSNFATQTYVNDHHDSTKQNTINDLTTIRNNASAGATAAATIADYGNIVTHNTSEFATAAQGSLAASALQPNDNITELTNNAGYLTSSGLKTINQSSIVGSGDITIATGTAVDFGSNSDIVVAPTTATVVVANPTTTTDTLTGITIGDTSYAVGGGSSNHLYLHRIKINNPNNYTGEVFINLINSSSEQITTKDEITSQANKVISANGYFNSGSNDWYQVTNIALGYGSQLRLIGFEIIEINSSGYIIEKVNSYPNYTSGSINYFASMSDTVVQLF